MHLEEVRPPQLAAPATLIRLLDFWQIERELHRLFD
jgi:hypothetical protein